jgi:hypothetical protein
VHDADDAGRAFVGGGREAELVGELAVGGSARKPPSVTTSSAPLSRATSMMLRE